MKGVTIILPYRAMVSGIFACSKKEHRRWLETDARPSSNINDCLYASGKLSSGTILLEKQTQRRCSIGTDARLGEQDFRSCILVVNSCAPRCADQHHVDERDDEQQRPASSIIKGRSQLETSWGTGMRAEGK
ncbi:hypothetical protein MRB53_039419 [Persea americana]|nr:hypothetical protein MRB53_039419 [Persea americana]